MALEGFLDICEENLIAGWARDSDHPESRVSVEVRVDQAPVAQVIADQYRKDLEDVGIGDGNYAFSFIPPSPIDQKSQRVSVVIIGSDVYLPRGLGPIPPEALRERVAGVKDEKWFHESGAMTVREWKQALKCVDRDMHQFRVIADFGCGCGRTLRHLEPSLVPEQRLIGLDVDQQAIEWCAASYPSVTTYVLDRSPPAPLEDSSVDLIISHSVFTHLPEEVENLWLSELNRVLTNRGVLITSVHGAKVISEYKDTLIAQNRKEECARFLDMMNSYGFCHFSGRSNAELPLPDYYGASFHTIGYINTYWVKLFRIRAWFPVFALSHQDVLVLQKA
jgi:SAM-dependent methyltransferase